MLYAIKVLRKEGRIEYPDRCCACGIDNPRSEVSLVSRPRRPDLPFESYLNIVRIKVPMCRDCVFQWRLTNIYWILLWIVSLSLAVIAIFINIKFFPAAKGTTPWFSVVAVLLIACSMGIISRVFNFEYLKSVYDEDWFSIGFRSKLFFAEFYDLNRKIARLTEDDPVR